MASFKHAYFLSYPHEPVSEIAQAVASRPSSAAIADALYAGLRGFGRRWSAWADISIFSDKRSLPAGSPLWDRIEKSIKDSSVFILLAVGRTASSPGVAREIGFWKKHGGDPERFLILWVEGEIHWTETDFDWSRTTALPNCLRDYFPQEPTIVDMRWVRRPADLNVNNKSFRDALATILSPVRGVPPGELVDEANAATRQALALAKSAVVIFGVLSLLLSGVAWYAIRQRSEAQRQTFLATESLKEATHQRAEAERQTVMANTNLAEASRQRAEAERQESIARSNLAEANRQRTEAERQTGIAESNLAETVRTLSAGLLAKAREHVQNGRVSEATILAAEALQKDSQNWPAYATLYEGLARLRYRLRYTREWCDEREFLAVSRDGNIFATVVSRDDNKSFIVALEQAATGQKIVQLELQEYPRGAVFSEDSRHLFMVATDVLALDLTRGVIHTRTPAKTADYVHSKLLRDDDSRYFWTIDGAAIYRFDMNAMVYDGTVIPYRDLNVPGFLETYPTHIARHLDSGYFALGVSGQSDGYTGEADNTGRIFLFDRTMTRMPTFIDSGLISDMTFASDDHGDASAAVLYVAKPGGTIELWRIPSATMNYGVSNETLELRDREAIVSRPTINFYTINPDPARSAKTQILLLGSYLAAFTSGRLDLIDVHSKRRIDSGLFDSREIGYNSDAFSSIGLTAAFATVSQNEFTEPRTQCNRLQMWDGIAGEVEAIDLREVFSRTFQERRRVEPIFEDLGATGEWKLKVLGRSRTRIAYLSRDADTWRSTRFVLNVVDIKNSDSELVDSYHLFAGVACAQAPTLYATDLEICTVCRNHAGSSAGMCVPWSGPGRIRPTSEEMVGGTVNPIVVSLSKTELLLSRIVRSVGGERIEVAPDGSAVLFRKNYTPLLWRGTGVLCSPVDEIRAKAMALTGLRVMSGLAVEVNATVYARR